MSRGRMLAWAIVVAASVIGLDQATKVWAERQLAERSIPIIPTVSFSLTYNDGISFSFGEGFGPWIGLVVGAVAIMLAVAIVRERTATRALLYAAIFGGAVGNLIDRMFRSEDGFLSGHVIDFINVEWFAVFNVADSAVVLGCIALVGYETVTHRRETGRVSDAGGVESVEQRSMDGL